MTMSEAGTNVVVVEDDSSMSSAIDRLLHIAGFYPIIFNSAEALLNTNAITGAACLISDIRLPGVSGFILYRRLCELGPAPPVIFITAHDSTTARQQAEALGQYLPKPFHGRALVDAVRNALASRNPPAQTEKRTS
jgi:FixJ family two-component response regulator